MIKETLHAPYSHFLLDAELSREIDRRTIEEVGIDGFTLMEIAGASAAKLLLEKSRGLTHGLYLCGRGNNGGDALVIARYLLQHNIKGAVVFISGTDNLSVDARKNLQLLKTFDAQDNLTVIEGWDQFAPDFQFDFIVDGMLGTGLDSEVRSAYAKAVEWTQDREVPIFAIDIPTGLHADTGKIMGCSVSATQTFAFGGRKRGFYLNDGPETTGEITYCELPFPNKFKTACQTFLLDEEWVPGRSPSPGRHKYDSGVLYIVAGSEGLTGAAIMAAQSAWAEGLGAVILICPRGVLSVYEHNLPSIIKKPVGRKEEEHFKSGHLDEVLRIIREKEGNVLLGPGLGREGSTVEFVDGFLGKNTADTLIDADALWCMSQLSQWDKPEGTSWILTPHPGEFSRLMGKKNGGDDERLELVRSFCVNNKLTLLSKGMPGIIGTPSGNCYVTNYNTRFFARAGSGDVLAGKVSAFLSLGCAADLSCAMGLLQGKKKLNDFLKNSEDLPEPKDFI